MIATVTGAPASIADYRRQARRIRASFHGDSFLTQQAIGELAKRRDQHVNQSGPTRTDQVRKAATQASQLHGQLNSPAAKDTRRATLHLEISAVVERGFAEHATSKLQPFGFTYSDRVGLLDAGEKLGISRFRANLILAMLENQQSVPRRTAAGVKIEPAIPPLLLVLALEILVVWAVVWFCIG